MVNRNEDTLTKRCRCHKDFEEVDGCVFIGESKWIVLGQVISHRRKHIYLTAAFASAAIRTHIWLPIGTRAVLPSCWGTRRSQRHRGNASIRSIVRCLVAGWDRTSGLYKKCQFHLNLWLYLTNNLDIWLESRRDEIVPAGRRRVLMALRLKVNEY